MKHHSLRSHALVIALVAAGLTMAGVNSSAANEAVDTGHPLQAGFEASAPSVVPASSNWLGTIARLEGADGGELASRVGTAGIEGVASLAAAQPTPDTSPILGTHPKLGPVAAPITRFRDGGHAYYLFGMGLHSCKYVGKCMDLFAAIGEPVYAMADGVVELPPYAPHSFGHYIIIKYRDGSQSVYAHLSQILVKPGPITAGARIGSVGCSGTSGESNNCKASEQHLHFEWSGLKWKSGDYGQLPPFFTAWRGEPQRCFKGCGPDTGA